MSRERKSTRQKRTIDYRQCAERDSDENDFESSPVLPRPSSKACRTEQQGEADVKDTKLKPKRKKQNIVEDDEAFIGSGSESSSVSDDDFSVSDPPQRGKPAARAKTKRVSTSVIPQKTAKRQKEKENLANVASSNSARTATQQDTVRTVSPPSKKTMTTSEGTSPKVHLPGYHGTQGLGMRRMPKWTPPGPAMGRENDLRDSKITTSGGGTPSIRVGLSRNVRVKPLHNTCSPHP